MGNEWRTSGKRLERKNRLRAELFTILGHTCKQCGTGQDLTFDLIIPALDDRHHRFNSYDRIVFYWNQHKTRGNVQVLCNVCNGRKGLDERYEAESEYSFENFGRNWAEPVEPF